MKLAESLKKALAVLIFLGKLGSFFGFIKRQIASLRKQKQIDDAVEIFKSGDQRALECASSPVMCESEVPPTGSPVMDDRSQATGST